MTSSGLETAIVGTWTTEKSQTMSLAEARQLVDDPGAFERLVGLHVIRVDGERATVTRPKLIEAFNEIRGYGVSMDKLIDLHEQILPKIDEISDMLVRVGFEHVADRIKPGEALPADAEVAELITMLVRFRTQAVATVTATLASSIESNDRVTGQPAAGGIPRAFGRVRRPRRLSNVFWICRQLLPLNQIRRQRGELFAGLLEFALGV